MKIKRDKQAYVISISQKTFTIFELCTFVTDSFFFQFQKEMQNIDQPFHYLANAYHKLYREKLEMFKGLA